MTKEKAINIEIKTDDDLAELRKQREQQLKAAEEAMQAEPQGEQDGDAEAEVALEGGEAEEMADDQPAAPAEAVVENIDYKDRYLRALAELDNATKTIPKRIQEGVERFKRSHFMNILDLADGFERALQQNSEGAEAWRDGVQTLHRLLIDVLAKSAVKPMDAKGKTFDPNWHEVVSTLPNPEFDDGQIMEVVRTGWTIDGRLLRAAMVVVVRNG